MRNYQWLYYAAAATTAIAGILHLTLAPNMLNFNSNGAILFFVGGAAQVFWAIPMARRWGRWPWYYVGIGGTLVLIWLWAITRMPGNPVTGRGGPVNEVAVVIETMQVAFVGLTAAIIAVEHRMRTVDEKTARGAT